MTQILDLGWTRKILVCLAKSEHPLRFNMLREQLGLPSTTLSRRLEIMRQLTLVKPILDEDSLRCAYSLTELGRRVAEEIGSSAERLKNLSPDLLTV